jgi:hypothetical protein
MIAAFDAHHSVTLTAEAGSPGGIRGDNRYTVSALQAR